MFCLGSSCIIYVKLKKKVYYLCDDKFWLTLFYFILGPALPYLTSPLYDIQQTGEVILGKSFIFIIQ